MIKACLVGLVFLTIHSQLAVAQSVMPTVDLLARVYMLETLSGSRGTIFTIDVDNREYWVTAKHMVTGAEHPPYGSVTATSVTSRFSTPAHQERDGCRRPSR